MGDAALNFDFDMEASELTAVPRNGRRWVECMVCAVGLLTACMSAASAIYKPPAGIFVGHKRAYYTSVVAAGVVGLVEACLAVVWLSDGRWQQELLRRRQQQEEGRHHQQQQEGRQQQEEGRHHQQQQEGRQQHQQQQEEGRHHQQQQEGRQQHQQQQEEGRHHQQQQEGRQQHQQQQEEGRHQQQEEQHQQQQERYQHERRRQQQQRRFARRCILCASLLPLAFMAGIGGVHILVK